MYNLHVIMHASTSLSSFLLSLESVCTHKGRRSHPLFSLSLSFPLFLSLSVSSSLFPSLPLSFPLFSLSCLIEFSCVGHKPHCFLSPALAIMCSHIRGRREFFFCAPLIIHFPFILSIPLSNSLYPLLHHLCTFTHKRERMEEDYSILPSLSSSFQLTIFISLISLSIHHSLTLVWQEDFFISCNLFDFIFFFILTTRISLFHCATRRSLFSLSLACEWKCLTRTRKKNFHTANPLVSFSMHDNMLIGHDNTWLLMHIKA